MRPLLETTITVDDVRIEMVERRALDAAESRLADAQAEIERLRNGIAKLNEIILSERLAQADQRVRAIAAESRLATMTEESDGLHVQCDKMHVRAETAERKLRASDSRLATAVGLLSWLERDVLYIASEARKKVCAFLASTQPAAPAQNPDAARRRYWFAHFEHLSECVGIDEEHMCECDDSESLIEQLDEALCSLLHDGGSAGVHSPRSHLEIFYARSYQPAAPAWCAKCNSAKPCPGCTIPAAPARTEAEQAKAWDADDFLPDFSRGARREAAK